jgi:broad specificity phosphatase PhoE
MAERVFIVRHGQTDWSQSARHTSHTDIPLTEEGRRQATALRSRLSREQFSLVLCSPLQRARETAELAGFGDRIQLVEELHEWDYGEYEGLTTPQIRAHHPDWNLWRDGCPGGESPDQVRERVDRVLDRFHAIGGDGLAFAHAHVLRVLITRWLEMEVAAGARFKFAAAGVGVLGHERETQVLESLSE